MLVTVEKVPSPQVITAEKSAAVMYELTSLNWKTGTLLKLPTIAAGGVNAPAVSGASATVKLGSLAVIVPAPLLTATLSVTGLRIALV